MKVEVNAGGRGGVLEVNGSRFIYRSVGSAAIEREYSVAQLSPGSFSVLIGGRSYDVIAAGEQIRVNGQEFLIQVFDPREMRGRKRAAGGEGRQNVAAPMPGKVVRVLVTAGDAVEPGQGLVVVEAMKMQNEMKSPKAGRVAEVKTRDGATVVAGDVLVVIE